MQIKVGTALPMIETITADLKESQLLEIEIPTKNIAQLVSSIPVLLAFMKLIGLGKLAWLVYALQLAHDLLEEILPAPGTLTIVLRLPTMGSAAYTIPAQGEGDAPPVVIDLAELKVSVKYE